MSLVKGSLVEKHPNYGGLTPPHLHSHLTSHLTILLTFHITHHPHLTAHPTTSLTVTWRITHTHIPNHITSHHITSHHISSHLISSHLISYVNPSFTSHITPHHIIHIPHYITHIPVFVWWTNAMRWLSFVHWQLMNVKCRFGVLCFQGACIGMQVSLIHILTSHHSPLTSHITRIRHHVSPHHTSHLTTSFQFRHYITHIPHHITHVSHHTWRHHTADFANRVRVRACWPEGSPFRAQAKAIQNLPIIYYARWKLQNPASLASNVHVQQPP